MGVMGNYDRTHAEKIVLSCCSLLLCCVFFFKSNRPDQRNWQGGRWRRAATAREQTSQSEEKSVLTDREEVKNLRSKNILWQNYAALSRCRALSLETTRRSSDWYKITFFQE